MEVVWHWRPHIGVAGGDPATARHLPISAFMRCFYQFNSNIRDSDYEIRHGIKSNNRDAFISNGYMISVLYTIVNNTYMVLYCGRQLWAEGASFIYWSQRVPPCITMTSKQSALLRRKLGQNPIIKGLNTYRRIKR